MLNMQDIMETITMIQEENLDIRTITMCIEIGYSHFLYTF